MRERERLCVSRHPRLAGALCARVGASLARCSSRCSIARARAVRETAGCPGPQARSALRDGCTRPPDVQTSGPGRPLAGQLLTALHPDPQRQQPGLPLRRRLRRARGKAEDARPAGGWGACPPPRARRLPASRAGGSQRVFRGGGSGGSKVSWPAVRRGCTRVASSPSPASPPPSPPGRGAAASLLLRPVRRPPLSVPSSTCSPNDCIRFLFLRSHRSRTPGRQVPAHRQLHQLFWQRQRRQRRRQQLQKRRHAEAHRLLVGRRKPAPAAGARD